MRSGLSMPQLHSLTFCVTFFKKTFLMSHYRNFSLLSFGNEAEEDDEVASQVEQVRVPIY